MGTPHHDQVKQWRHTVLAYRTKAIIPAEIGMPTLRTAKIDMVQNDEALEINLDLLEEKKRTNGNPRGKKQGKDGKVLQFQSPQHDFQARRSCVRGQ
ncbi:hypothetical protein Tco_1528112 [Tanacetum coccineum]